MRVGPVRVAFFGNVSNNLYHLANTLRACPGVDAHLYIDRTSHQQQLPESHAPRLRNGYPPWIHKGSYLLAGSGLAPWRSPLVRELSAFDLIVVSSTGPVFTQFTRRPTAMMVTGGDLTVVPFPWRFRFLYRGRGALARALWTGFWQRRGIRALAEIWSQPFLPFRSALDRLGIERSRSTSFYCPVTVDAGFLRRDPTAPGSNDPDVRALLDRYRFVLFHPARIMIDARPRLPAAGQWKGNDLLIRGFARFVREQGARDAVLVCIDRPDSPDIAPAKELIAGLGIGENVHWLTPPRPSGYTLDELITFYSISHAVADDVAVGWFGGIVLEALALGCPVLNYIDEAAMRQLYPWHPILSANTEEGIAGHLARLHGDPAWRAECAARGRAWVERYHDEASVRQPLLERVTALARG